MIVALDTATPATAVALCSPDAASELEARDDPPAGARPRHATRLLPLLAEVMERAEVGWGDVDRIAVGVGPGTFTGLRIGIATAKALARARGIGLIGVSTLHALAGNGAGHASIATVAAVLDARRGEVFLAAWPIGGLQKPGSEPLIAPAAISPEQAAARLGELGTGVLALGDGAVKFRTALEPSGAAIPEDGSALHRISALGHCRLARALTARPPDEVRPEYLRVPDAELSRRTARPR